MYCYTFRYVIWNTFHVYFICQLCSFLFVYLFIWGLSSHLRIFHSYGDVTNSGEGLHILSYARHSWPLSSEGSVACHTHCDTGHPFIMVISEDPWHSHLLPNVWQWSCHCLFLPLRYVAARIQTSNIPRLRGQRIKPLCHRCGAMQFSLSDDLNKYHSWIIQAQTFDVKHTIVVQQSYKGQYLLTNVLMSTNYFVWTSQWKYKKC